MNMDNDASQIGNMGPVKGKRSVAMPKISKKWAIGVPVAAILVGFGLYEAGVGSNNTAYHITNRQVGNDCLESFRETGFGKTNILEVTCADGTGITITDKGDDFTADLVRIVSGNSEGYTTSTYKASSIDPNEQQIISDATIYLNNELWDILAEKTTLLYEQMTR